MPTTSIKTPAPGQQGFTLIEIIAVLVILGILSAVAVPKYMDMQSEARQKGLESLISAAQSNLHAEYAKQLLVNSGDTNATWDALSDDGDDLNEVCRNISADGWLTEASISCDAEDSYIEITAEHSDSGVSANGNFTNPQEYNSDDWS